MSSPVPGALELKKNADNYDKIVEKYLESIIWTFDYYYNRYDIDENYKSASIYMYKYNRAPIIRHIYEVIKKKENNYLNIIQKKINDYYQKEIAKIQNKRSKTTKDSKRNKALKKVLNKCYHKQYK